MRTSEKKRASTMIIINLTSSDTCKSPPRMGSQRLAPNRVCPTASTAISAMIAIRYRIGRLIQDGVVVQAGQQQHQDEAHADPVELVRMHSRKVAGVRRGPDFEDAYAADGERRGQQPPVVVADTYRSFASDFTGLELRPATVIGPLHGGRHNLWAARLLPCTSRYFRFRSSCRNRLLTISRTMGAAEVLPRTSRLDQSGHHDFRIAARREAHKPAVFLQFLAEFILQVEALTWAVPVLPENSMFWSFIRPEVVPSAR